MPAGHDDGSPAKKFADQYRKDRQEVAEEFRLAVEAKMGKDTEWCAAVEEKMRRHGFTLDNMIQ
jgi:hypothetical protein